MGKGGLQCKYHSGMEGVLPSTPVCKLHDSNWGPQRILILSLFSLKIGINRFNDFGLKPEKSF